MQAVKMLVIECLSSLYTGYPLFLFHRFFLRKAPPPIQHAFFAISGMLISYWSIGLDSIIHSSTCILVSQYFLKRVL